ncbi:hypothetical protein Taro_026422 [Colocasia esculenta]|uniref:Uncharacterized protein n=1 Tax=Colocasia esculenta TaxID=4460 RepID=A0A843VBW5_COLES|nr:hypothetical protein [Colocasia esculenta]
MTHQHNAEANPRHTPAKTKKLTKHRSHHVRLESHNTSTNIPDLHEAREEQPGVTTRDTKKPCEKQRLTTATATSDLHNVKGQQAETTLHLEHSTRSGNYTLLCHHGWNQGTGY